MLLEIVCFSFLILFLLKKFFIENDFSALKTRFSNQIVVVTGASSGLGKEFTKQFYENGAKVIMVARRTEEMMKIRDELVLDHGKNGEERYEPKFVKMDLADENIETNTKIAQQIIDVYGKVDILINNAGVSSRGSALETNIQVDRRMMFVNYLNQINLTKIILKNMIEQRSKKDHFSKPGHIVGVSSVQGKIAIPFRSSYSATKHALQAFYDSLRAELQGDNIPVNITVISPGYIKTDLSKNALTGTGKAHGKMDKTTASGEEPEFVVRDTIKAIFHCKPELVNCPLNARFLIFVRPIFPSLYFALMKFYAKKQKNAV